MIKKARCVIAHFDELEPEGQKGKLYGPTVTAFMLWTGVGLSDSKRKMFVEEYFNKEYKDRHFGYNFWKWAINRFKSQKDIFTHEERMKIFEMMKEEFKI